MANKTKVPQKLRRNERERRRVHQVNLGFNSLRDRVPLPQGTKQKLSKVETLREAARYIQFLRSMLGESGYNALTGASSSSATTQPANLAQQLQAPTPSLYYHPQMSPFYPQAASVYTSSEVSPCASSYYGSESSYEDTKFTTFSQ